MRSIQSRNRNFGIRNAQLSANATIRCASDRPSMYAMWCAFMGYVAQLGLSLREQLQHPTMVPCVVKTQVTGGTLCAVAPQRPGRHPTTCRHAAR